jgi:hypothetical protein
MLKKPPLFLYSWVEKNRAKCTKDGLIEILRQALSRIEPQYYQEKEVLMMVYSR